MYDMLCPGCGHRTAMMLLDDIIGEKKLKERTILALDVACCSLLIDFVDYDSIMCAHGRVLDVTKGYKTVRENAVVISYMGDGAAYSCDPYTRGIYEKQAYYTDKEGNVMCDSNHEPMKIDYKKDLKN